MTFDFDDFHPLDHVLGGGRCRELPGGLRTHLAYWRDFQRPRPVRALLCRLGRHRRVAYWSGVRMADLGVVPPTGYECAGCGREMEA